MRIHARCLDGCLLENTHNLGFKFHEIQCEYRAARVENEIAGRGQQVKVAAQSFFHAALDAIALVRLAQNFANGEPNAWRNCRVIGRLRSEKPAHRCGLAFAAGRISALIISMLAQAQTGQRLPRKAALVRLGKCGHGNGVKSLGRNSKQVQPIPAPTNGGGKRRGKAAGDFSRGSRR